MDRGRNTSAVTIARAHVRVGVMNELQYRANFVFSLVQSLLGVGTAIVVLAILFRQTDDIAGWTRPELFVVMGVYTCVRGVLDTFVQPNMQRIVTEIREGKLDYALTKPADAQVLASARDVRFWSLTDVLVGTGVIVVGMVQLDRVVEPLDLLAFVAVLLAGAVCIYSFWLILASAAFWLVRVNEVQELFDGVYRAGTYPVGIYPRWMRAALTWIVPLAFAVTVPAEALTGRISTGTMLVSFSAAIGLALVSRLIWRAGLRRYDGASS
jgi:ABC-2 type transport system permease protein